MHRWLIEYSEDGEHGNYWTVIADDPEHAAEQFKAEPAHADCSIEYIRWVSDPVEQREGCVVAADTSDEVWSLAYNVKIRIVPGDADSEQIEMYLFGDQDTVDEVEADTTSSGL